MHEFNRHVLNQLELLSHGLNAILKVMKDRDLITDDEFSEAYEHSKQEMQKLQEATEKSK